MSAIDDVLNVCRDPIFKPTEELEAEARADLQAAQERIAKWDSTGGMRKP